MNVSDLVGKTVVINEDYKNDFYYECEFGGVFDYDFLEKNEWKGEVVSIGCGRNINIVVVVGEGEEKKYFELEDIEVMVDGISVDEVVDVWDWENVKSDFKYDCECGMNDE